MGIDLHYNLILHSQKVQKLSLVATFPIYILLGLIYPKMVHNNPQMNMAVP